MPIFQMLPFDVQQGDALSAFDSHFDELAEGVKEMSLTHMAMRSAVNGAGASKTISMV